MLSNRAKKLSVKVAVLSLFLVLGLGLFACTGARRFLFFSPRYTVNVQIRDCCIDEDLESAVLQAIRDNDIPINMEGAIIKSVTEEKPGENWTIIIKDIETAGWGFNIQRKTGYVTIGVWRFL